MIKTAAKSSAFFIFMLSSLVICVCGNSKKKINELLESTDKNVTTIHFEVFNTDKLIAKKISPQEIIFRNKNTWGNFWSDYGLGPAPPINFTENMIIGLFEGRKANPGYDIEISRIKETDTSILIDIIEYRENPERIYMQVIVYPYQIIKLKKTDKRPITTDRFLGSKVKR